MKKKCIAFLPAGYLGCRYLFLVLLLLSTSAILFAQTPIRVAGTVKDNKGASLQGVSVTVKGSVTGVTTDANGQYTISVPSKESVLVFSFVGYLVKEQEVKDQQIINVALADKANDLE